MDRVDVAAAGQEQAVSVRELLGCAAAVRSSDDRIAAGHADRFHVVGNLAARRDDDAWHGYIRAGTAMPIRSSARVSCSRT